MYRVQIIERQNSRSLDIWDITNGYPPDFDSFYECESNLIEYPVVEVTEFERYRELQHRLYDLLQTPNLTDAERDYMEEIQAKINKLEGGI